VSAGPDNDHRTCGGAPVDDAPTCPDCGDEAEVPGARCEACVEFDRFGDVDEALKFEAENVAAEEE
jgi:hypothetical protein